MRPSETQFKAEAMHPTGIRLPAGLPVRIVASGEIKREATAGLLTFCEKLAPFCDTSEEVKAMLNTSLPPWGDVTWYGDRRGFAQLWWDGPGDADGNTVVFPQDDPVIRRPWPGGELWAGHSYWECYWVYTEADYTQVQGDCFNMSGSWAIAVVPDDGSETDPQTGQPVAGSAVLTATLTSTVDGSGFHVAGKARAADGTPLADQHWIYVADAPPAPMMASSRQSVGPLSTSSSDAGDSPHKSESLLPRATETPNLAPSRAARAPSIAASVPQPTEAAEQFIASCDGQSECVADVGDAPGKLVVQAAVGGVTYSAYATVSNDPKLTCPEHVTRGETGTCELTGVAGSVTVTGWKFEPDSAPLGTREAPADGTLRWSGAIVASGTATAQVTIGTVARSFSAHMTVDPRRDWPKDTVKWTWEDVSPDGLPEFPTKFEGQLGHNVASMKLDLDAYTNVSGGPNDGLGYFLRPPGIVEFKAAVNTVALATGSKFYHLQVSNNTGSSSTIGGVPKCSPYSFPHYVELIWTHEGTAAREENSHVDTTLEEVARITKEKGEGIIGDPPIQTILNEWNDAASAYSHSTTDGSRNPLNGKMNCEFNFF